MASIFLVMVMTGPFPDTFSASHFSQKLRLS